MPVALYAFILRPNWGPDLIQAGIRQCEYSCRGKFEVKATFHSTMEDSNGEGDSPPKPKHAWFWILCFLFPPNLASPTGLVDSHFGALRTVIGTFTRADRSSGAKDLAFQKPQPEYDVFPSKADYNGPETQWWDIDDVLVGKEHGRPEDEWWELTE